jgi:hypothetical protein
MADHSRPFARYRPRGQGFLVFERNDRRIEVPLDDESVAVPPPADSRLAAPPPRGRIDRIETGHALTPHPGATILINHRPVARRTVLHGGDMLDIDGWAARYVTAREELAQPITVVIWPPEGTPIEVRSHRARLTIGAGDADIQVDDDTVDGKHCTIRRFANGIMSISDDKSYNGTFVDGKRVGDSASLRDGAEIRVGRTRIKAWTEGLVHADGSRTEPVDEFDGLPKGGFDPRARAEPLRPYAVEVGPDFVQTRRRTFADDVPTRFEGLGETVDVRAKSRRPPSSGYGRDDARGGSAELPSWAPSEVAQSRKDAPSPVHTEAPPPSGRPTPPRRSRDDDDELEFGRRKAHNLTLVHGPGGSSSKKPPRRD